MHMFISEKFGLSCLRQTKNTFVTDVSKALTAKALELIILRLLYV